MKVSELDITFTPTYNPSDIYGGNAVIPEGYELVDFRPFRNGDTILGLATHCVMDVTWDAKPINGPFIILRKKREFHEKYKFASGEQPRPPKTGELFISLTSVIPEVFAASCDYGTHQARFIVEEIKDNA